MGVPFDHIESAYDAVLSKSAILQLQRKQVWRYIQEIVPELNGFELLELSSGAGEDSVLFDDGGFNLVATDISNETQKIIQHKKPEQQFSMQHQISSHYLDLESFNETLFHKKFDLVFSNFGSLNGINPESMRLLFNKLPLILNPGGRFVGVIMPKFCAWETLFFLLRFQFGKAFRRLTSKEVITETNGVSAKTWFYHPSQLKEWSREKFKLIRIKPVGVILPPSYLEKFFSLKKRWVLYLNKLEKKFNKSSIFSGIADNFIIDLQVI